MPRDQQPPGRPTFKYVRSTAASVNDLLSRQQSRFDSTIEGARFFFPKNGEHVVRILPWHDHEHWAMTPVWEHRFVGVHNSNYLCLQLMQQKRCPICEEERAIKQRDPEAAKKIAAKLRYYLYILERRGLNSEEPQVWNIWDKLHRSILLQTKSSRGDIIEPADPDNGFDMVFVKSGSGMHADYDGFKFDQQPCPIFTDPKKQQRTLEFLVAHPLDSLLVYKTAAYLEQVMGGTVAEPDEDLEGPEPVEEAPRRRARVGASEEETPSWRRAAAPNGEEDDDDEAPLPNGDEDEEEQDDEETKEQRRDRDIDEEDEAADVQVAPVDPPLRRRREPEPEPTPRRRTTGNGDDGRPVQPPQARAADRRPSSSRYNRD
jgi:hypothetical protein